MNINVVATFITGIKRSLCFCNATLHTSIYIFYRIGNSFFVSNAISRSNLSLKLFFCNTRCMGTNIDIHIMKASANISTRHIYIQTAFLL